VLHENEILILIAEQRKDEDYDDVVEESLLNEVGLNFYAVFE